MTSPSPKRFALDGWVSRWVDIGDRLLNTGGRDRHALRRHLHAWLFLSAVVLGAISAMDRLTTLPDSPTRPASPAPSGKPARMFVLMLDSLRWQTAMDGGVMPSLAALRGRGVYARFIPTRDGVTVPALRAAFSGSERTSVFGFVRNLSHSDAGMESLFSQARAAGLRTAAYSDGSFLQFGARTIDFLPNAEGSGDDQSRQERAFRSALDDFRSGRHEIVIAHLTYGDHRTHELLGVKNPLYPAVFRRLDGLVQEAADAVRSDETLLVMGDHGHDEEGHHGIGLEVPTSGVYRGPAYRAGADLGTLRVSAHRYLAGAGLALPLPGGYRGQRPAQALVPPLPPDYAGPAAGASVEPGIPAARRGQALALVGYLGVLGLLWATILLAPVGALGALGAWAAVAPLALPGLLPWSALGGALLALGCLITVQAWSSRPLGCVALAALAAAVAMAFMSWGALALAHLPMMRPRLLRDIPFWTAALCGGWAIARRWGPGIAGWLVLGSTLFLFFPTLHSYGAPTVMGPAWLVWLILQLVPLRGRSFAPTREQMVIAVTAGLLLSQFCMPDASNFTFKGWRSAEVMVPHWWSALALVALPVILLDPGRLLRGRSIQRSSIWIGAGAALFVQALHSGRIVLGRAEVAVAAALALAAVLLRGSARRGELRRILGISAGLVAMHALIRVPAESYLWADIFLALVALSADLALVTHPRSGASRQSFLLIMGIMAVGWSMFTWSLSRLEWHFLYDWMAAETVERHAWFLVPLILARFAIPVWLIRFLLAERFGERSPPLRLAWLFVGAKVLTVMLVACGAGWVSVETDVYLSAVQQDAVWLVVLAGLA